MKTFADWLDTGKDYPVAIAEEITGMSFDQNYKCVHVFEDMSHTCETRDGDYCTCIFNESWSSDIFMDHASVLYCFVACETFFSDGKYNPSIIEQMKIAKERCLDKWASDYCQGRISECESV